MQLLRISAVQKHDILETLESLKVTFSQISWIMVNQQVAGRQWAQCVCYVLLKLVGAKRDEMGIAYGGVTLKSGCC